MTKVVSPPRRTRSREYGNAQRAGTGSREPGRVGEPSGSGACALRAPLDGNTFWSAHRTCPAQRTCAAQRARSKPASIKGGGDGTGSRARHPRPRPEAPSRLKTTRRRSAGQAATTTCGHSLRRSPPLRSRSISCSCRIWICSSIKSMSMSSSSIKSRSDTKKMSPKQIRSARAISCSTCRVPWCYGESAGWMTLHTRALHWARAPLSLSGGAHSIPCQCRRRRRGEPC